MRVALALGLTLLGLALGTFSSLLFAWQWVIGTANQLTASILVVLVLAVFLGLFVYLKQRLPQLSATPGRYWILPGLPFVCAVGYAGYWIIEDIKRLPQGDWDAWAIWNLHARFLYRGSAGLWREMFSPALSLTQNDYPLLLPGLINGAWMTGGAELTLIPSVFGVGFAALSIAIVCTAVSALANDERGWMAGLVLLATPSYLLASAYQMADVPIGLYILTTVVLLQFAAAWPGIRKPTLILAGLSAGFAAWTKQEGLLFVVGLLASYLAGFALLRAWRPLRANLAMILWGLAPMLLLNFSFKIFLAPTNDVISLEILRKTSELLPTIERFLLVTYGFWDQAKGFGGTWLNGIHPALLVALFLYLYGLPVRKISPSSLSFLLLIPAMLAGYFMVYLITPAVSIAFLTNSLDRLLLQLWPACLFILATVSLPANDTENSTFQPSCQSVD